MRRIRSFIATTGIAGLMMLAVATPAQAADWFVGNYPDAVACVNAGTQGRDQGRWVNFRCLDGGGHYELWADDNCPVCRTD